MSVKNKTFWLLVLASGVITTTAVAQELQPELSVTQRIKSRTYPSVFQAWSPAQNADSGPEATEARHDLYFTGWQDYRSFRLQQANGMQNGLKYKGLASEFTKESIKHGLSVRQELLRLNPLMVLLAEVRYFDAKGDYLPDDSPWWLRKNGRRVHSPYFDFYFLDFSNPGLQQQVAVQCHVLVKTGIFDGCFLDWWHDHNKYDKVDPQGEYRLKIIKGIRKLEDKTILMGNTNGTLPVKTAPYLNGMYMEGFNSKFFPDWRAAASNLLWAQTHLRPPVITAFEGWYPENDQKARHDYALMREITAISLVFSDGYVLFSDPNSLPTPDHLHDWYTFWDKRLGSPTGPLGQPGPSGSYMREFEEGTVIFNPPGNARVHVHFPQVRMRATTQERSQDFDVNAADGELFLKEAAQIHEKN